jgi:hypothetical protein
MMLMASLIEARAASMLKNNTQVYGDDHLDTFSLVNIKSVRILLCLAARLNIKVFTFDVNDTKPRGL